MSLASTLVAALRARGLTLALAESCTGGLVAATVTAVPGASAVLRGALVAYHVDAKRDLLGVDANLLSRHGAVSREAVVAMAAGARDRFRAHVALATTGYAGPEAPPGERGRVLLALADARGVEARDLTFPGDREAVREQATEAALAWLLERM